VATWENPLKSPKILMTNDEGRKKSEIPNSKIQHPEKLQKPSSNPPAAYLKLGVWSSSGCWMLEFVSFPLGSFADDVTVNCEQFCFDVPACFSYCAR
jgi:hypothetical protein